MDLRSLWTKNAANAIGFLALLASLCLVGCGGGKSDAFSNLPVGANPGGGGGSGSGGSGGGPGGGGPAR